MKKLKAKIEARVISDPLRRWAEQHFWDTLPEGSTDKEAAILMKQALDKRAASSRR